MPTFARGEIQAILHSIEQRRAQEKFSAAGPLNADEFIGPAGRSNRYTKHQGSFFSHRITLEGLSEDAFAQSLSTARVDMNPHQIDAALFALSSPLTMGVLLADEVGLGKTIEAALVIAQKWAERHRRVLLIVPASLRKQWSHAQPFD
jgi:RecG-like helicase